MKKQQILRLRGERVGLDASHAHQQRRVQRHGRKAAPRLRVTSARDWWVYVVCTATRQFYCGISTDVHERVRKHNRGQGAKYLRGARLPCTLLLAWSFQGENAHGDALRAELIFKKLSRPKKCAIILDGQPPPFTGWDFYCREAYVEQNMSYIRGSS